MRVEWLLISAAAIGSLVSGCGGGGGGNTTPVTTPTLPPPVHLVRVSQPTTFTSNCDGAAVDGTLYVGAAVEPYLAVNPTSPVNIIGIWQQNRWSSGGSQGLMIGASFDGGSTWKLVPSATSRCTGGSASNGGNYARASDPWITFSPDGTAYGLSLSFTGQDFAAGSTSGMVAIRSIDGGMSWSAPVSLIQDDNTVFNDKGSITADPANSHYVYAVWDRVDVNQTGPTELAMTSDAGMTWKAARSIYDPGTGNQTLGNQVVVLPDGTVVDLFTEIDVATNGAGSSSLKVITSADHGSTWSLPRKIADVLAVGASDPQTSAAVRDGSDLAAIAENAAGTLYVVWQDARFSSGARDGVALSQSSDKGTTWSAPVQVNAVTTTQAFTPAITITAGGVAAVTYYDFRNDTSDPSTLLTDYWLVTSTDATRWIELHLSGPFDLDLASNSQGLFLGDYQALASAGTQLLPFFVQPSGSGQPGHTDVFLATLQSGATSMASTRSAAREFVAPRAQTVEISPEWRKRMQERVRLTQARHRHPVR